MPGVARNVRYRVAPPSTAYQYASMIVAPVTDFVRHDRSSTSPTAAGAAAAPTVEAAGPACAATAAAAPMVVIPNAATAAAAVFANLMLDILHRPD